MKLKILSILFVCSIFVSAQPVQSLISSRPGAFSRMGFGARGIGMGNAMSSVIEGNLSSYYNPAISSFQEGNSFQTSYSFLSLDRTLNYLNFTKRFDFYNSKDTLPDRKPRSSAGFSVGIINAGVTDIDERDNSGVKLGDLSTSENQFFIGLANRFSERFALGIAVKFYYYKLYEKISATSLGIDLGALYKLNKNMNISFMLTDLNSKYKWDTAPVYEQQGLTTTDKFPLLKKIGVSYLSNDKKVLAAAEFESSNAGTNIIRFGVEYNIIDKLYLRGGIDQYNLKNKDYPVKPSLGFSFSKMFGKINAGVDYAFVDESFAPQSRHIVGINIIF